MKKHVMLVAAFLSAATLLAACGGSDDPPPATAVSPPTASIPMNSAAAVAVVNQQFQFPAVPELGTSANTSLSFTSTSTNPSFSISSGGNTASGTTAFGSCIFRIGASDFPPNHALAAGQEVRVDPCLLDIFLDSMPATGQSQNKSTTLKLGRTISVPKFLAVAVSPTGVVTLFGIPVGTVTVTPVTGSGS